MWLQVHARSVARWHRCPAARHIFSTSREPARIFFAVVAFLVLASLPHENVSLADNRMCPCNCVVWCVSHWALRSWQNQWDNPTITTRIFAAIDSFAPPLIRVKVRDESIPIWPRFGTRAHISQHACWSLFLGAAANAMANYTIVAAERMVKDTTAHTCCMNNSRCV